MEYPHRTVLLIDDNNIFRSSMRDLLELGLGVTVLQASSIREGFTILIQNKVDLLILDVQMPEINGIQGLKFFRNDPRTASIMVIACTAESDRQTLEQLLQLGIADFIVKSLDRKVDVIIQKIEKVLRSMDESSNLEIQIV